MSTSPISTDQLKVRLIEMIGAQDDPDILQQVEKLLEQEETARQLAARVAEGEQAIAEGRYREAEEARSLVRERIARKYGG